MVHLLQLAQAVGVEVARAREEVELLEEPGGGAGEELPADGVALHLPAHAPVLTRRGEKGIPPGPRRAVARPPPARYPGSAMAKPTKPYLDLPSPWLVAHRGGSALAPENTLAAFDRADALGADAIETDVRLSRDGVVMVFHDEDTRALTGAPGTIEARTRRGDRGARRGVLLHARTAAPPSRSAARGCASRRRGGAPPLPAHALHRRREERGPGARRRARAGRPRRAGGGARLRRVVLRRAGGAARRAAPRRLPLPAAGGRDAPRPRREGGRGAASGCPPASTSPTCPRGWAS